MSRHSSPPPTKRPSPPDPLDALLEAQTRVRKAAHALRDADDEDDEQTGRARVYTPQEVHVHLDGEATGRHAALNSFHDADVPKKNPLGLWLGIAGTIATIAAAIAHALGLV